MLHRLVTAVVWVAAIITVLAWRLQDWDRARESRAW